MELKNCPFCGGEALKKRVLDGNWCWYYIECPNCLVKTANYPALKIAKNVWNRRAELPNSALTLDELRQIVEQLELCGYECQGVPLEMNTAFIRLKEAACREKEAPHEQD